MNTKIKGDISVSNVITKMLNAGYAVSIPFGDCQRYDLIVDKDDILQRVQVKTGRIRKGAILFSVSSVISRAKKKVITQTYVNQVDSFAVYVPLINKVYFIPFSILEHLKHTGMLRLDIPKNNQVKKVINASLYEMP